MRFWYVAVDVFSPTHPAPRRTILPAGLSPPVPFRIGEILMPIAYEFTAVFLKGLFSVESREYGPSGRARGGAIVGGLLGRLRSERGQ